MVSDSDRAIDIGTMIVVCVLLSFIFSPLLSPLCHVACHGEWDHIGMSCYQFHVRILCDEYHIVCITRIRWLFIRRHHHWYVYSAHPFHGIRLCYHHAYPSYDMCLVYCRDTATALWSINLAIAIIE